MLSAPLMAATFGGMILAFGLSSPRMASGLNSSMADMNWATTSSGTPSEMASGAFCPLQALRARRAVAATINAFLLIFTEFSPKSGIMDGVSQGRS